MNQQRLTSTQRKIYLDLMIPRNTTNFVEQADYTGSLPQVRLTDTTVIEIVCSPYQRYNMSRRDTGEHWDSFFEQLGVPATLPMKHKEQDEREWLKKHFTSRQSKSTPQQG